VLFTPGLSVSPLCTVRTASRPPTPAGIARTQCSRFTARAMTRMVSRNDSTPWIPISTFARGVSGIESVGL
jgi:hypothetical protein